MTDDEFEDAYREALLCLDQLGHRVGAAEIGGELVANLQSAGTVLLRSTARFFGDVEAGNLVIESGAVFVGAAKVGSFA